VVNKHHPGTKGEYIGRGSPLGNPYPIGQFGTRDECIAEYEKHIIEEIKLGNHAIHKELKRLHAIAQTQPVNLMCFCAPLKCHGEVIKNILEGKYNV
jgi:uncharacterized protein YeaO (DUF488 family)